MARATNLGKMWKIDMIKELEDNRQWVDPRLSAEEVRRQLREFRAGRKVKGLENPMAALHPGWLGTKKEKLVEESKAGRIETLHLIPLGLCRHTYARNVNVDSLPSHKQYRQHI